MITSLAINCAAESLKFANKQKQEQQAKAIAKNFGVPQRKKCCCTHISTVQGDSDNKKAALS